MLGASGTARLEEASWLCFVRFASTPWIWMTDVLEMHDKENFEIYAYDGDQSRRRTQVRINNVDHG
jgi:predicted O-linked N-acetylglucosamine transferase (SPINDLY family)